MLPVGGGRQRQEAGGAVDGGLERLVIGRAADLHATEARQMVGDELGVEQTKAAGVQPGDQGDQSELRGVAAAAEHALAEEGGAERDAVEAARQRAVLPDLDGMGMAQAVQLAVERQDAAR